MDDRIFWYNYFVRIIISEYTPSDQQGAKQVVLNGLKDFRFEYHDIWDSDLENPKKHYIDRGGMFFVLKVDGKIVGTVAIINKGNNSAELKRLYVNKEYQGKGLGSKLLDAAIAYCKKHGFIKLEFETNKKFTKAHLLYQKRGFKTIKEDKSSYYMEKEL